MNYGTEIPFGEGFPALRCHHCRRIVQRVSSIPGEKHLGCDDCKAKKGRAKWNADCRKINARIRAK